MNYIVQSVLQHLGVDQINFLNPFEEEGDKDKIESSSVNKMENPIITNNTTCTSSLNRKKKTVTFQNKIKVILVPTVAEYHHAGCDLWWKPIDYETMRESFRCEIETALRNDYSLQNNIYLAMTKLYQPNQSDLCHDHGEINKQQELSETVSSKSDERCLADINSGNQTKHSAMPSTSTRMKRKDSVFIH